VSAVFPDPTGPPMPTRNGPLVFMSERVVCTVFRDAWM